MEDDCAKCSEASSLCSRLQHAHLNADDLNNVASFVPISPTFKFFSVASQIVDKLQTIYSYQWSVLQSL